MADNQEQLEVQNQSGEPEVKNFLDLSDDEIANLDETQLDSYNQNPEPDEETEQYEEEEHKDTSQESTEETTEGSTKGSTEDYYNQEQSTTEEVSTEAEEANEEATPDESVYKDVYDRLFNQPVKANGKNLKLTNVDDVIRLVQMGANYNLKMAGIKEQIPYLKMLERNDLLDEGKLSYLIDLHEGKQGAIARLLKEHNVDLYDFDTDTEKAYVPQNRSVSMQEIQIEDAIKEISTSDKFLDTMKIIQEVWDEPSRDVVREDPEKIKILNEHIETGIYAAVSTEVERMQLLGHIPDNVPAIQVYETVGQMMYEKGLLNGLTPADSAPKHQEVSSTSEESYMNQEKRQQEEALKRKRRAATATTAKSTVSKPTKAISPLSLSDEEFAKLGDPSLL